MLRWPPTWPPTGTTWWDRLSALAAALSFKHSGVRAPYHNWKRDHMKPPKEAAKNPIQALQDYGQSVWLDYIRRSLITSGELQRLIDEDGLLGVTSNPSIFEKA